MQPHIFGGAHNPSDFSIFKDSLRKEIDKIHEETRSKLPSAVLDEMSEEEEDVSPLPPPTSTLADANRSCGPPKPGRRLLNGVRRCRRGSAGGPLGPDEAPEGPWGGRGVPRGSVHQSCTNTGQSSDPSSSDGSRRAKTGFRRKPIGTQYGPK